MKISSLDKKKCFGRDNFALNYFLERMGGSVSRHCEVDIPTFCSQNEMNDWFNSLKEQADVEEVLGLFDTGADFSETYDGEEANYYVLRVYNSDGRVYIDGVCDDGNTTYPVFRYVVNDDSVLFDFIGIDYSETTKCYWMNEQPDTSIYFNSDRCDLIQVSPDKNEFIHSLYSPYWALDKDQLLRNTRIMRCATLLKLLLATNAQIVEQTDTDPSRWYEVFYATEASGSITLFRADNSEELLLSVIYYADEMLEAGLKNIYMDVWNNDDIVYSFELPDTLVEQI